MSVPVSMERSVGKKFVSSCPSVMSETMTTPMTSAQPNVNAYRNTGRSQRTAITSPLRSISRFL